jgi:ribonuclease Z
VAARAEVAGVAGRPSRHARDRALARRGSSVQERAFALGFLKERVLTVSEGRKLAYVTDTAWTARNVARAIELACNAEVLFVEATFLDRDRERAAARRHLTALQAGTLARLAGAKRVVPFHFSPRHADEEAALRAEVEAGFNGEMAAEAPT